MKYTLAKVINIKPSIANSFTMELPILVHLIMLKQLFAPHS